MLILILLGVSVMIILSTGIILFVVLYQRRIIAHQLELKKITAQKELELIQASIHSQEEERTRIASELHDDVAATLSSARLFLYKGKDSEFTEEKINQSKELLDESLKKIRDISHSLQPSILQHLGLQLSLQALMETIDKSGSISGHHIGLNTIPRATENIELGAYRISQELITNILKHAGASKIIMESELNGGYILIIFIHDGVGLTNDRYHELIYKKGATGLKNIVNRLKYLNGTIDYYKEAEQVYRTVLSIPFSTGNTNL